MIGLHVAETADGLERVFLRPRTCDHRDAVVVQVLFANVIDLCASLCLVFCELFLCADERARKVSPLNIRRNRAGEWISMGREKKREWDIHEGNAYPKNDLRLEGRCVTLCKELLEDG